MNDREIIDLYIKRDEKAILQTAEKYSGYCTAIAQNILKSQQDAQECVNDTYLKAWNSIPPAEPKSLCAYLGRIARNTAFNKYKQDRTQKHGGGETELILEELSECIKSRDTVETTLEQAELTKAINTFLATLPEKKRGIFVCRYWYAESLQKIADGQKMKPQAVAMTLSRTRKKLREYLSEKELY